MSRYIKYIVALILLGAGYKSRAQDIPQVWDLKTAIEYAKEKNISINTLKLSSQTAEQNLIASKAAVLPNLSGNVSQAITNYKSGLQNTSGFGLSSDMTLYNGSYLKRHQVERAQPANRKSIGGSGQKRYYHLHHPGLSEYFIGQRKYHLFKRPVDHQRGPG